MERVDFQARDGTRLVGILEKSVKRNAPLVILCHGLSVTKDEWNGIFVRLSEKINDAGIDVFRFDFRGHGESSGRQEDVTVFGEVLDLEAAFDYCKKQGYRTIGILGASYGGAVASSFLDMGHPEIRAVVLWNPLLDGTTVTEGKSPWSKKYVNKKSLELLEKQGYLFITSSKFRFGKAALDELRSFSAYTVLSRTDLPVLIVHGDKDTYIPYSDSVKATVVCKQCSLEILEGAEHGFDEPKDAEDAATRKTVEWFKKHLLLLS